MGTQKNKAVAARRREQLRRRRQRERNRGKTPDQAFVRSSAPRVTPESVEFVPMVPRRVGGALRIGWHVNYEGKRAGKVTIQYNENDRKAEKGSIYVHLNKASRGRGIGTIAFRRASEMSGSDEVTATIAKKNIASRIAAERAGFAEAGRAASGELVLKWRKRKR